MKAVTHEYYEDLTCKIMDACMLMYEDDFEDFKNIADDPDELHTDHLAEAAIVYGHMVVLAAIADSYISHEGDLDMDMAEGLSDLDVFVTALGLRISEMDENYLMEMPVMHEPLISDAPVVSFLKSVTKGLNAYMHSQQGHVEECLELDCPELAAIHNGALFRTMNLLVMLEAENDLLLKSGISPQQFSRDLNNAKAVAGEALTTHLLSFWKPRP